METNAYIDYLWEVVEEKKELEQKLVDLRAFDEAIKVIDEIEAIFDKIRNLLNLPNCKGDSLERSVTTLAKNKSQVSISPETSLAEFRNRQKDLDQVISKRDLNMMGVPQRTFGAREKRERSDHLI